MQPAEKQSIPSAYRLTLLNQQVAALGLLTAPTVMLFQNNISPGINTGVGDLIIATFTGYASTVAMPWETPYIDIDGSALVFGTNITQVATDAVTPNTIYGYALCAVALAALWIGYRFATPVGMAKAGDGVTYLPTYRFSGT